MDHWPNYTDWYSRFRMVPAWTVAPLGAALRAETALADFDDVCGGEFIRRDIEVLRRWTLPNASRKVVDRPVAGTKPAAPGAARVGLFLAEGDTPAGAG